MERTLVLIKPDAVQRGLVGRILERFERKGLRLVAMKLVAMDDPAARALYSVHEGKEFYERLVAFITASPVVAMVLEANEAIAVCRSLMGATFGPDAVPGTIRGDFGLSRRFNLVHGSDGPESAEREIAILFDPAELLDYPRARDEWLYDRHGGQWI